MPHFGSISVGPEGHRENYIYICSRCEKKHKVCPQLAFLIPGSNVHFQDGKAFCPHPGCSNELKVHNASDYSRVGRQATRFTLG